MSDERKECEHEFAPGLKFCVHCEESIEQIFLPEASVLRSRIAELERERDAAREALEVSMKEVNRCHETYHQQEHRAKTAEKKLQAIEERNTHFGPSIVPDSLKALYSEQSDAGRDFRLIIEDRRVTDLSADYWMKQARQALAGKEGSASQNFEGTTPSNGRDTIRPQTQNT